MDSGARYFLAYVGTWVVALALALPVIVIRDPPAALRVAPDIAAGLVLFGVTAQWLLGPALVASPRPVARGAGVALLVAVSFLTLKGGVPAAWRALAEASTVVTGESALALLSSVAFLTVAGVVLWRGWSEPRARLPAVAAPAAGAVLILGAAPRDLGLLPLVIAVHGTAAYGAIALVAPPRTLRRTVRAVAIAVVLILASTFALAGSWWPPRMALDADAAAILFAGLVLIGVVAPAAFAIVLSVRAWRSTS